MSGLFELLFEQFECNYCGNFGNLLLMRIFTSRDECPLAERRPAITMGIFDGVHLGHRRIIDILRAEARSAGTVSLAITFSPHPRQALGRAAPPGICSLERRLELLGAAGVDGVWVIPFTSEFAQTPPRRFAEEFFHLRLSASAVVMGEGATFGNGRGGTMGLLGEWARPWGMSVRAVSPLLVGGSMVSSTAIRLAVQGGDLGRAAGFLGRLFSVEGTVVHGQGRGARLGFPTLNLDPHHELRPPPGVYLTRTVIDGVVYASLTNIGRPPTEPEIESGLFDFLIETHLLDVSRDFYGKVVEVEFIEKTREVMRFSEVSELVERVRLDLELARAWFASNPSILDSGASS